MLSPKSIASLGFIQKKEKLDSIKVHIEHAEFILEATHPYPGYYSPQFIPHWAAGPKARMLYLIIEPFKISHEERVTRIGQYVKKNCLHNCGIAPGYLNISGKYYCCIRLRMDSIYALTDLLEKFKEYDIKFLKKREIKETESMIKVQKFFKMHYVNEDVYQDMVNSSIYYIHLPGELSWEKFEKGTIRMKNSLQLPNFDAALASIYQEDGFLDFIRIYAPDLTSFDMDQLKDKYLNKVF
ncbi:MAG: hypothetical protein R6U19_02230 [Bacteroidales bacterium]